MTDTKRGPIYWIGIYMCNNYHYALDRRYNTEKEALEAGNVVALPIFSSDSALCSGNDFIQTRHFKITPWDEFGDRDTRAVSLRAGPENGE